MTRHRRDMWGKIIGRSIAVALIGWGVWWFMSLEQPKGALSPERKAEFFTALNCHITGSKAACAELHRIETAPRR